MFYTLTLNPSLDHTVYPQSLESGQTNRSLHEDIQFGGKGINVAAMLQTLGEEVLAIGFAGGFSGDELIRLVEKAGIAASFVRIHEPTRINTKIAHGGVITEINAKGPSVRPEEEEELWQKLALLRTGDVLVLSGSVPSTFPKDIYKKIMTALSDRGVDVAVDASGDALRYAIEGRPFLIKPNKSELEEWMGCTLSSEADLLRAAKRAQDMGARNVLVSLGEDGAMLLDESGSVYRAKAPKGVPKSTVGAGDSMLAGFLYGWKKGASHALAWGIAAGSATAFSDGIADASAVYALLEK